MQSIKKLKKQLQKISQTEEQMKNINNIDETPILQLLMYRKIVQRKKKICEQINQTKRLAKGAKLLYDYETSCWIDNMKINCRKYKRLERKARYRRDFKLYKYGFIEKRPISPTIQFIESKFPKLDISNNVFFKKIKKLNSKFFSKNINKLFPKEISQNFNDMYKSEVNKYKESLRVQPQNITKTRRKIYVKSTVSRNRIPTEIRHIENVIV